MIVLPIELRAGNNDVKRNTVTQPARLDQQTFNCLEKARRSARRRADGVELINDENGFAPLRCRRQN